MIIRNYWEFRKTSNINFQEKPADMKVRLLVVLSACLLLMNFTVNSEGSGLSAIPHSSVERMHSGFTAGTASAGVMPGTATAGVAAGFNPEIVAADLTPELPPAGFGVRDSLRIHLISASAEYESEKSLKKLKRLLEQSGNPVRITASWGEDGGDDLPDIQKLAEADLMIVFARRMNLPDEQLNYILQHVEAEKPVIGLRTASHAFQDYLEFDSRVFGGDYDGHGNNELVELKIVNGAVNHTILKDFEPFTRPGMIYHNPRLGPRTEILLSGEGLDSGIHEPVAWVNRYGEDGKAFYTSMGLVADFKNTSFIRMIFKAISWSTGQEMIH